MNGNDENGNQLINHIDQALITLIADVQATIADPMPIGLHIGPYLSAAGAAITALENASKATRRYLRRPVKEPTWR